MILFRYLAKDILQSTFAVTLVLLLIVTSGRLAKYLSQASSGELAPDLLLWVILYRIPDFLPLILPLGLFVGILLAYGRMYVESEMTVIYASGVSKLHILWVTLIPAFFVSVLVAMLTLWAAPAGLAKVQSLLEASKRPESLMLFRDGSFKSNKHGDSVVYIEQFAAGNGFKGIFLLQQKNDGEITLVRADSGQIEQSATVDQQYVTLKDGTMYEGRIGEQNYKVTQFGSYSQKIVIKPQDDRVKLKIDALPTVDMLDSKVLSHVAALHWRFSLPATVIVVGILAMGLSKTNHRTGRYAKMLPAILLYLFYIVSLSAMRDFIEKGQFPGVFLWLVHLFYLLVAVILLFGDELKNSLMPTQDQGTQQ